MIFTGRKLLKAVTQISKLMSSTDTVFKIISNFIPSETILIDDKDPHWINKKIKDLIHEKDLVCKKSP